MWDVRLAGVGQTLFGRYKGSIESMAEEAVKAALDRAGMDDVDAVVVASMSPMGTLGEAHITSKVVDKLGLVPRPALRVESGPATGAAAFHAAFWAVASGQYETVLVVAAEKLSHLDSKAAAGVLSRIATQEERALGLTMPGLTAMLARAYMHRYGAKEDDLADLAVKAHRAAAGNPHAHLPKPVTRGQVLESPMIADPLRKFNCAPLSDGAVAAVVTSKYTATVRVVGIGAATDVVRYQDRRVMDGFPATRVASKRAMNMADYVKGDVHLVETHDAFSNLEWSNMEDLGLLGRGEGIVAF
jgi:acetyl-CoA C-acetyltransferase